MNKRIILLVLSVLLALPTLAQTSVVKQVERMAKKEKSDLKEARRLIASALTNPETAEDPYAWYVAGLVREKDVDKGYLAMQLGQEVDEDAFYTNLYEMATFYQKASELDGRPNDKGKVRRKFEKKIADPLSTYYVYLVNAGAKHLDKQEFEEAVKYFEAFLNVKKMDIFQDLPVSQADSLSMQIGFFNAYAQSQIKDNHAKAIEAYEAIKDVDYRQSDVYQLLALEYYNNGDTEGFTRVLREGAEKFPEVDFFLNNLIDSYIKSGKSAEAKQYLDQALASKPDDPQLRYVYGMVYEQGDQNLEKALELYAQALKADPESAVYNYAIGRCYFNLGVATRDAVDQTDVEKYKASSAKADQLFKDAIPYFKKAVELDPANREYMSTLSRCYYVLGMEEERTVIEEKLAQL